MQTTQDRLNELSIQIGQWADSNFKIHLPRLGVLEEVGEMTHCVLKRFQGIRGFDNPAHFRKEFKDAIADAAIYLLHHMHMEQLLIEVDPLTSKSFLALDHSLADHEEAVDFFATLNYDVTMLLQGLEDSEPGVPVVDSIFSCLAFAAIQEGIFFMESVEETWANVSKRNWVQNPENAHTVQQQQLPPVPPGNEAPVTHK